MEIIKFVGSIILIGVIAAFILVCMTLLVEKVTSYLEYKNSKKWVANDYPIPSLPDDYQNVSITRSIEVSPGVLTYSFSIDNNKSVRLYRYRSPKEAMANYEQDFNNEQYAFIDRHKDEITDEITNNQLIQDLIKSMTAITARADHIEAELNQLKHSLGETSD